MTDGAHPAWSDEHPLVRRAQREQRDFELFQLLNLIEQIDRRSAPLGRHGPARDEGVRLRPVLDLVFPPGDIDAVEWTEESSRGRLRITTTFGGLYGSDSPLPTHVTERLLHDIESTRIREFLDLFHHRLLSLLYRVWLKYRYHVTFRGDGLDPISHVLRGLIGLDTAALDDKLKLHPVRLFRYAGLLTQRPHSATSLAGQLRDFFPGVDFSIEQCTGRWLWIEPGDRNRLGEANCGLGENLLVGERVYDRAGKFRIRVGPVDFKQYCEFLPPGKAAAELREVVQFFCTDPLEFDLEVTLRKEEVPETPLGERGMYGRLAWTSWVRSGPCPDQSIVFQSPRSEG